MIHSKAVLEETRRIRELQWVVALALQTLATQVKTRDEALAVIDGTRHYALRLFPDKQETFDLIYGTRLRRVCRDRFGPHAEPDRS